MNDRQRKDRLIQTRVPQDLESTLKDEARKRRLSVSHLIRNVLEDTFNLVDNVVVEVDRVVTDSVGMAQTLKRDAQRLAATARGETAHREEPSGPPASASGSEAPRPRVEGDELGEHSSAPPADEGVGVGGPLSQVYAFQELVLNRPAECARCEGVISRGSRAYLGLHDIPDIPRVWVCEGCMETMSGHDPVPED